MPATAPPDTATSPLLAAIDMGSNSFRLEVGQMVQGRYRRSAYFKETVRLGAGLDAAGLLTPGAAQRGLECLRRFAQQLQGFGADQVRAVATQTLREARNRNAFLAEAQGALGFPVEVISGREEARLIYAGVAHLQPGQAPRLVVDIGGRSTEMILGRGLVPQVAESFAVGSVSLSMRWFAGGEFTAQSFRDAQVAAGAELEEALAPFAPSHWREALGSSGTVGAVADVLRACRITDGRITPEGLRWLIEQCLAAGHMSRLNLGGLRDDRRAVVGGGLAILYTLATHFGITELHPAKGALRQGVIVEMHQRRAAQGPDLRDASVAQLQKRMDADAAQARRVAAVARTLWQGAGLDASLGGDAQRELLWAAALHEIGLMVSHHDHHRHAAYLMGHADLPGFSQNQQRRLADLLLAQRGGLRKAEAALADIRFAWQALVLRLAVIACHAREPVPPAALRLAANGAQALLAPAPAWAGAHPRTLHLLREEAQAWQRQGPLTLALAA